MDRVNTLLVKNEDGNPFIARKISEDLWSVSIYVNPCLQKDGMLYENYFTVTRLQLIKSYHVVCVVGSIRQLEHVKASLVYSIYLDFVDCFKSLSKEYPTDGCYCIPIDKQNLRLHISIYEITRNYYKYRVELGRFEMFYRLAVNKVIDGKYSFLNNLSGADRTNKQLSK